LVSLPARAGLSSTYTDAAQAKQLIMRAMQLPQSQNATAVFYSDGISHFDSFVPCAGDMKATWDMSKPHYQFTYHDGRISKAEYVNESGKVVSSFVMWNNSLGAPVLEGCLEANGTYQWYMYAEFDSSGKMQTIYRFNAAFELQFYDVFSYEDNVTSIKEFSSNSQLRSETLYAANGDLFVVINGEKRLANHVDRKAAVCELVKFGLKPFYPSY
jgi:hypothetical protein